MTGLLHSRAYLLLEKDLFKIQEKCKSQEGINIDVEETDIFEWNITFHDFKKQLGKKGNVIAKLQFDEHYNEIPPRVYLTPIIDHANVNPSTGEITLPLLHEWTSKSNIFDLIIQLRDFVYLHQRGGFKLSAVKEQPVQCYNTASGNQTAVGMNMANKSSRKHHKLSFEKYHESWKKLGTTKTEGEGHDNPLIKLLQQCTLTETKDEPKEKVLNKDIMQQLCDHNALMYGQFHQNKTKEVKQLKLLRDGLMKQMYKGLDNEAISPNPSKDDTAHPNQPRDNDDDDDDEFMRIEANELLAWTQRLPLHDCD